MILLLIIFASPVWKIPPPTTNSPTIMITVELANPASPSAGVSVWHMSNASNEQMATRSDLTLPLTNKAAATARIINVLTTFFTLSFIRALTVSARSVIYPIL